MMRETGTIVRVDDVPLGDAAAQDHAAGESTLHLDDTSDFAPTGGHLVVNGQVVEYVEADDELGTLALFDPLPVAVSEGDTVAVYDTVSQGVALERQALVELSDVELGDEPVPAVVEPHLAAYIAVGGRSVGETVVVEHDDEDDWRVVSLVGQEAKFDGGAIDPDTLPDTDGPTAPPAASPVPEVTGSPESLIVTTADVEPGTFITYHLSTDEAFTPSSATQVGESTRATVFIISTDAAGDPLVEGTQYYLRTQAANGVLPNPAPSAAVPAALNTGAVNSIVAAKIAAGFILTGRIQVGTAYLDADEGLVIPQPDGGTITLPVDGATAARITAHLVARTLTVEGKAIFGTLVDVLGTLTLGNGPTRPSDAPLVTKSWPFVRFTPTVGSAANYVGLTDESGGAKWITAHRGYGFDFAVNPTMVRVDKATGVHTDQAFTFVGGLMGYRCHGLTRIGTSYYGLFYRSATISNRWTVKKIDTNGVELASWVWTPSKALSGSPVIGTDGTNVLLSYAAIPGPDVVVEAYTTTGTYVSLSATALDWSDVTAVWRGTADLSGDRIIVTDDTRLRAFSSSAGIARQDASEWGRANSSSFRGLWWDGTRFASIDASGRIHSYSAETDSQTEAFTFDWTDGTKSTGVSPTETVRRTRRSWIKVEVPSAPTTPTGLYARIFGGVEGGVRRLQATLAVGAKSVFLNELGTSTTTETSTNTFTSAGVVPGLMRSGASDTAGPAIWLKGDGSWRLGDAGAGPGGKRSFAKRYAAADQPIATATETTLTFNTEVTGRGITYTSSTGAFTVDLAGTYLLHVRAGFAASSAGRRELLIYVGSTKVGEVNRPGGTGATRDHLECSEVLELAAGDVVTFKTLQSSGGTLNVVDGLGNTSAKVARL